MAEPAFRVTKFTMLKRRLGKWYKLLISLVIAAMAVVAVVLLPTATPETVQTKEARIRGPVFEFVSRRDMLAVPPLQYTGFENIYIARYGKYDPLQDLSDQQGALDAVITESGQTISVTHDNYFDIVVAVRIKAPDNIAYLRKDNIDVWLAVSGAFAIPYSFAPDDLEYLFENEGYGTNSGFMRLNVVWDNNDQGYALRKGEEITIEDIKMTVTQIGV